MSVELKTPLPRSSVVHHGIRSLTARTYIQGNMSETRPEIMEANLFSIWIQISQPSKKRPKIFMILSNEFNANSGWSH
jgi:hypothetical protein